MLRTSSYLAIESKVGSSTSDSIAKYKKLRLNNSVIFSRTCVRNSKMNDAARAQLTFQMLTLLAKIVYIDTGYQANL